MGTGSALEAVAAVYVVALGAALGSFVNVLIARLPAAQSVVRPGSRCAACQRPIAWYDNLPLVSYLVLGGRCRFCRAAIGLRTLTVEALAALLALGLWLRFGLSWDLLVWLPASAALLAICYLDLDHFWVPDALTAPLAAWLGVGAGLPGRLGFAAAALGLVPAALLWALAAAYERLARREGMGLGDVKLLAVLGLGLGAQDVVSVLMWAALQGSLLGGIVLLLGGHRGALDGPVPAALADDADWQPPAHAVPFGPFLVLAALEVLLRPDIFLAAHVHLVHSLAARLSLLTP